jgi:pimeloyl-ACP methyl ester carboxylesterase
MDGMTLAESTTDVTFRGMGGVALAADARGAEDAPPVVLLHGGGQTRHSWGTTAAQLAAAGWRAYTVDLRGHGESEWAPDGDYRLDAFAGDVREIARSLSRPPVLVGASLGGIASLTAIAESEPPNSIASALVLVDVAPRMEQDGVERIGQFMTAQLDDGFASLEEVADAVAAYNPHRPRPIDLAGLRKNVRQRDDGRWVWHWDPQFISGRFGSRDETRASLVDPGRLQAAARAITIPTLLVRGRVSDLLSEEGARELLELIPHARLVDVAGAGHMVAGDRNDLFNEAVVSFLQEL